MSVGGLVATPKQIGVGCYAGQTMFAANGKLLMPACTLGNGHPIGMQNTTRADIPAGDDNVMPARRFPPPWTVEELDACFVVRDGYFDDKPPTLATMPANTSMADIPIKTYHPYVLRPR